MATFKIIQSGHILEVYEYEKLPNIFKNGDDKKSKGGRKAGLKVKNDRSAEYKKTVNYRARENIRRMILSNFNDGDTFLTLTFAEEITDIDIANKEFKKFIQRMHRRCSKENIDFKYVAVMEIQKERAVKYGAEVWHYHIICNLPLYIIPGGTIKDKEVFIGTKIWKQGFVDIEDIKGVDNCGAYLLKYLTKDNNVEDGRRRYLNSRNLDKSNEIDQEFIGDILHEISSHYPQFTSTYETEFWGKISYREYNLLRDIKEGNNEK